MTSQSLRRLEEQLLRLEEELKTSGLVDIPVDAELEELLEQAVLEGALPPKSEEDIAALEALLEGQALPEGVSNRLKRRWESRFARSRSEARSFVGRPQPRFAVAFRKDDSKSEKDHARAEAAIERFRRELLNQEDQADE